jgi:hypothetical protein
MNEMGGAYGTYWGKGCGRNLRDRNNWEDLRINGRIILKSILWEKPQGKKQRGRPKNRWKDNKVYFQETGGDVDWVIWLRIRTNGGLL